MKSKFLKNLDHDRILAAIRKVEKHSTGEIRVQITHKRFFIFQDEMKFARQAFAKMGMHQTQGRNHVLLVVFPERRKVVILGDEAIHKKMGEEFWRETLQQAVAHFKTEKFSEGIIHAVGVVGAALAIHFPREGKAGPQVGAGDVVEN